MEWWHVYLFTRLDGIIFTMVALTIVAIVVAVIGGTMMAENRRYNTDGQTDPDYIKGRELVKLSAPFIVFFWIAWIAIPTQKEAAAIYLLPKLANSGFAKEAAQLPTDAAKLMRLKLEAWISDMEPKKE
jgi:heme/copper-type cytochrome/quinol oxidase subunit 2